MRRHLLHGWMAAAFAGALLLTHPVRAEQDTFFLGSGRDGALSVTAANTVINRYAQVIQPLAPGDRTIKVGSVTGFGTGDLVLVLQTTGVVPVPASGTTARLDITNDPVGRWELARVHAVSGSEKTLTVTAPLIYSYAGSVTQVVRVPEYTSVTINSGAGLSASSWDGNMGGIIAFLATGTLKNDGQINANGAGFRGGAASGDTGTNTGCTGLDEASGRGAQKGEGIANTRFGTSATGRGNVANAGGGGVCFKSGGAGGGNGGAGGKGGRTHDSLDGARDVGGMPGVGLSYSVFDHLLFGGGGGSGHGNSGGTGTGGRGGGIIFIRGNVMEGAGTITANGLAGAASSAGDAGGGGGAGGTAYVRMVGTASCTHIRARGGSGGGSNGGTAYVGTGGGGGSGSVLLQSSGGTCSTDAVAGSAGTVQSSGNPYGLTHGAQNGSANSPTTRGYGFFTPAVPEVQQPAHGAPIRNLTVTGRLATSGTVVAYVDGEVVGQGGADASGNFTVFTSVSLTEGPHTLRAAARHEGVWGALGGESTFIWDRTAPAAPVIAEPAPGSRINQVKPTIKGTAEPGSEVEVTLEWPSASTQERRVTAGPDGTWSISFPSTLDVEGIYKLRAIAFDAATNVSPASSITSFVLDVTPPGTAFTSDRPDNPTQERSATFSFQTELGSRFQCKLDTEEFRACISPVELTQLGQGVHTFQVRAVDDAGNVDASPESHTWRVDFQGPVVTFRSTPPKATNARSATYVLEADEPVDYFLCKLDTGVFGSCTSPIELTELADGSHTFEARARDGLGNFSSETVTWTWTVDSTSPDTFLSGQNTQGSNASFTFSGSEEGGTFECKLDTGEFSPCSSPNELTALAEGNHTFQVRARDAAGNVDATPASHSWTVSRPTNPGGGGGDEKPDAGGCACSASGFDPSMSMMALAGLAAFVSRRRRK